MTAIGETGSKLSIVRIIQVLLRESDKDHPLTQQEILSYLEDKYGMVVNRKSIGRNLTRLREAGLPVKCREVSRMVNGKETSLSLDWYWDHVLSPEELQVLIDCLYFSHLSYQQVKQITEKLKGLQSLSFEDGKGCIRNLPCSWKHGNGEEWIAVLSTAIKEKKQISFYYDHYEADGKRHHNCKISGEEKKYQISPYVVIASDDWYYLLGNQEGREDISAFAVDLLAEVEILDTPVRLQKELSSQAKEEKLSDYLTAAQEIYVGYPEICTFEADRQVLSDIVRDFGKTAHLLSATQEKVTVEVMISPAALKAWSLRHAPEVRILSPAPLVKEVKEAAYELARLYGTL